MAVVLGPQDDDVSLTDLRLDGLPIPDYLAVFVRDPENPRQYWFRKMRVARGSMEIDRGGRFARWVSEHIPVFRGKQPRQREAQPGTDIEICDLGEYNWRPCPETMLDRAKEQIYGGEQQIRVHSDPKLRKIHAAVGVAEYKGNKPLAADNVAILAGLRYQQMRASYRS